MTDEKLIEMMAEALCEEEWKNHSECVKVAIRQDIQKLLSVISVTYDLVEKGKVHEYAALCQGCGGVGSILKISSDAEEEDAIVCPDCHGHGIVKIEKK